MSKETWIIIGIAVVQTAITGIGILVAWRMATKQIQLMLEQTSPLPKPKMKIVWPVVIIASLSFIAILNSVVWIVYYFIYPLTPRLMGALFMGHMVLIYVNFRVLKWFLKDQSFTKPVKQ